MLFSATGHFHVQAGGICFLLCMYFPGEHQASCVERAVSGGRWGHKILFYSHGNLRFQQFPNATGFNTLFDHRKILILCWSSSGSGCWEPHCPGPAPTPSWGERCRSPASRSLLLDETFRFHSRQALQPAWATANYTRFICTKTWGAGRQESSSNLFGGFV